MEAVVLNVPVTSWELKTFLDSERKSFYPSRGGGVVIALASRSHMGTNRACAKDKPASGPLARRGSNPFPGAMLIFLL